MFSFSAATTFTTTTNDNETIPQFLSYKGNVFRCSYLTLLVFFLFLSIVVDCGYCSLIEVIWRVFAIQ